MRRGAGEGREKVHIHMPLRAREKKIQGGVEKKQLAIAEREEVLFVEPSVTKAGEEELVQTPSMPKGGVEKKAPLNSIKKGEEFSLTLACLWERGVYERLLSEGRESWHRGHQAERSEKGELPGINCPAKDSSKTSAGEKKVKDRRICEKAKSDRIRRR